MQKATPQRSVFITGGGSGLGAATARHLAKLGWHVALAGRTLPRLHALAEELKGAGAQVQVYPLDVSDAAATEAAIRSFAPQALVCCAAILGRGEATGELTPEQQVQVAAATGWLLNSLEIDPGSLDVAVSALPEVGFETSLPVGKVTQDSETR